MSPPELSGYTPVTDIIQPVVVCLVHTLRNQLQLTAYYCFLRRLCHLAHLDEPLWLYKWLYRCLTAVMCTNHMLMWYNLHEKPESLQVINHCLSCLVTVHACVLATKLVDCGIIVHNIDLFEIMTLSNLKIVRIVCRCDLYTAGSEIFIYIRIRDHRDLTIGQRQLQHLAYNILVALIFRIDCHGCIAKQRLRTCGCDLYKSSFFANNRIIDVPEEAVLFLVYNLCIGNGCLTDRTPVYDTGTTIHISFFIQLAEYLCDCLVISFIHRETLTIPVCRGTHLLQLVDDLTAVLSTPVPDTL